MKIPFMSGATNTGPSVVETPIAANDSKATAPMGEVGIPGLTRFGNMVMEDFNPTLRWPRAGKIYQEMSLNDPVIGAIIFTAEMLIRKATWTIEPGGKTPVDLEAAQFLQECMDDMSVSWIDTITEILSLIVYGWSFHEIVYKTRGGSVKDPSRHSLYDDNRIGWRKIAGRSQLSMRGWEFDETDGGTVAMIQQAVSDTKSRIIPLEKALLFRTKIENANPEGKSILRNAYRPWYFKKHIEEIEGIGIERDLAGLPVITVPDGIDIWGTSDPRMLAIKNAAETLVRSVRRDQNEGIVLPFGWDFKLTTTGGSRQFDTSTIINRYDQRIAITLLADIVMLGADKVGSFALADVKKGLLATALEAILESIAGVFNRHAVPRLFSYNSFPGLLKYPKLISGEVETPNLNELGNFIQKLAGAKMPLFPDEDLENYLRSTASMPKKTDKSPKTAEDATPQATKNAGKSFNNSNMPGGDPNQPGGDPNQPNADPNNPNKGTK